MTNLEDLLERFRRAPEVIAMMLTGVFGEEIDFTPAPGKWSIRQITRHLADAELVGTYRFRSVIAEPNPPLQAYDEAAWAANLDYATRKPAQSLDHFRRLRADNYELLKSLPPAVFERKGTHSERGELTLMQLVEIYADHAESHARQLQAAREAYKLTKPPRAATVTERN
jgi:hypothetical protein